MICPYCRADLGDETVVACAECGTAVHTVCARAHGACVTYGCGCAEFTTELRPGARTIGSARLRLEPAWPMITRWRALARAGGAVVRSSVDDAALAALGCVGLAKLVANALW